MKIPPGILCNAKTLFRGELSDIDDDKILFYDFETTHQYAPYCKLKTCSVQYGLNSKPIMVDRASRWAEFKRKVAAPDIIKVDFNGVNFDRTVAARHNIFIHPQNAHDVFQMFKTISPRLPAFGQKFISFYFLGDPHFPEMAVYAWMNEHGCKMHEVPMSLLAAYNKHDIVQLVDLFRIAWDIIIRPEHWDAYLNDALIYEPNLEMTIEGGIYLDAAQVWRNLQSLQKRIQEQTKLALKITDGQVQNPNSSQQLAKYLTEVDNIELELTEAGQFSVKKSVLVALMPDNELARCAFQIRDANGTIKYMENYLHALEDDTHHKRMGTSWIPIQYSWSSARTRRTTSQSYHKLNFQNPNEMAKSVQIVPEGELGFWIDATQIENVVHIYESDDIERRSSYEADKDWNEYVWLCNQIHGENERKDYWDDKDLRRSPRIPSWTVYKETKTGKLAINFGMGIDKFCKLFGLTRDVGEELFSIIHSGCPAIRELQRRVARDLKDIGYVKDVFGKRYSGPVNEAYKVVAYLIQGCGTGSLPKAQIRANWETLRRHDKRMPERLRRRGVKCGVMCTSTHDENGGRINLQLGDDRILQLLQKMMYNMTEKFSPLFDNIPLRAKLYLSKTSALNAIEVDINKPDDIYRIINGQVCPICKGSGHSNKEQCKPCRGIGYVL